MYKMHCVKWTYRKFLLFLLVIFLVETVYYLCREILLTDFMKNGESSGDLHITSSLISQKQTNIFKERKIHANIQCALEGRIPTKTRKLHYPVEPRTEAMLEINKKVLYCPILKVGSTFWNRILVGLSNHKGITSPYNGKSNRHAPNIINIRSGPRKFSKYRKSDVNKALKEAISFVVVRDPYTKLFSGYADKLYNPNFMFWRLLGQKIQNLTRNRHSLQADHFCGHDVTFSEFLKYIVYAYENKLHVNRHFVTFHEQCDPCDIEFDYILKLETFKNDSMYLLTLLQQRYNVQVDFTNFERENAMDIASVHVRLSFITMKKYGSVCNLSIHSFLLRTWRFLQLSGIIPVTSSLPVLTENAYRHMTEDKFLQIISDVIKEIQDWDTVRSQRKAALRQAFQSVEIEDLMKIRKILEPDCRYFGYNCSFSQLLINDEMQDVHFNYFDALPRE